MAIALLLLLLVLAYWAILEYLRKQWLQEQISLKPVAGKAPFVSLIVVCRNEAANLPQLFAALEQQSLAADQFELHLIDDGSTDGSKQLAEAQRQLASFPIYVHALEEYERGGSPKKAAIAQVLPLTKGAVVAVTDADCMPAPGWLRSIQVFWQQHLPVFVSGPVRFVGEQSLFDRLQVLDFAALIGVGGAMLKAGRPGMCNAANMVFSKEAFYAVGGYAGNAHVPSGDDEFLLQKLAKQYPKKLFFLGSSEAIVSTQPCDSWRQFVQQRKRWAGKWKLHKGWSAKGPAIAVFVFYLLLLSAWLLPLWSLSVLPWVGLAWLVKGVADWRFLCPVMKLLGKPLRPGLFLLMELVYPVYVLFFAVAANRGGFVWKDRSYRYTTSSHERTRVSGTG